MHIYTDIDPVSDDCLDPSLSWVDATPNIQDAQAVGTVLGEFGPYYMGDASGKKLSKAFPTVIWRKEARESQIGLAKRVADLLPADSAPMVFVSSVGNAFRGHFDRSWVGVHGNLHVTVLVKDKLPPAKAGSGYAILPVLALYDTAATLVGKKGRLGIKWINDVLLDGAKVGGALSETRFGKGFYDFAVMGMGLNTKWKPDCPSTPFVPRVGSLSAETSGKTPFELLSILLSSFALNHSILVREGGAALIARYRKQLECIDRRVYLFADGHHLDDRDLKDRKVIAEGVVEGVDDDGGIVIDGKVYREGRLAYVEDCP